jgi:dolichyl-phosphate-mannose-protein mannosyltransferase
VFLGLLAILLFLLIVPAIAYYLFWLPHLHLNPKDTFWGLQQQILTYHQGVGRDVHPYCSSWQSWLLMLRPVAYFYKRDIDPRQLLPLNGPTASGGPIYDVHSMGNPMLWWSSTAALGLLLCLGGGHLWRQLRPALSRGLSLNLNPRSAHQPPLLAPADAWVVLFLGVNFGANLLPWIPVNRCIYLYHYMGSSVYALLGLAWLGDRWLRSGRAGLQLLGQGVITLAVLGLIFWLPIYLGLPLPGETYRWRMWLDSWI